MSQHIQQDAMALWQQVVESRATYARISQIFLSDGVDRLMPIQQALRSGRDSATAIAMLPYLKPNELMEIFPELVRWASITHGQLNIIRNTILSLPKEWLVVNIESVAEPLFKDESFEEYRRLLELYSDIDDNITSRLAQRALTHSDKDINEAGEDFIEKLKYHRARDTVTQK